MNAPLLALAFPEKDRFWSINTPLCLEQSSIVMASG
jgi:hypothetical protein